MTEYKTKGCHQFGHKEIVVSFDSQSGLDPTWLVRFLEKSVAEGKRYKSDETIQVGWMVLLLKENQVGSLDLWEPQFDSIPIKWTIGVNNTLRHLILQKSVADLLRVEPEFSSLRQSGFASNSFLATRNQSGFRMKREASVGNDSGWQFSVTSFVNQDAENRSLYELSFHQMAIVPFLALPSGACIIKSVSEITVKWARTEVSSKESQLLENIAQSKI
jgi:hypothetical protein